MATRNPALLVSHWQQGCNDAKAGKPANVPFLLSNSYSDNERNRGYMNGYRFGKDACYQPTHDEGSRAD